jgi:uncharacterized membrane protein YphA (DoxX/SURF4 family)
MELDKYKAYAAIVLRIGMSLVFLWFGFNQLINPESFLGYLPQWIIPHSAYIIHEHAIQILHNLPSVAHLIIMGNGIFETAFGLLLILGIYVRISALLLSMHMLFIMTMLGYNDIAVRDFGILVASATIFLNGNDKFCIENMLRRNLKL